MPNWCAFEMKVAGKTEKSVNTFISWLKNDYFYSMKDQDSAVDMYKDHYQLGDLHLYTNADKHFFRIDDIWVKNTDLKNGKYCAEIDGACAWSVWSCMMKGEYTYYNSSVTGEFAPLAKDHATNLIDATKELGIAVEVYSKEPGMGFAEHYLIDSGEVIADQETGYRCFFYDHTPYREAREKYNLPTTCTKKKLLEYRAGKLSLEELKEEYGAPEELSSEDIDRILNDTMNFNEFKRAYKLPSKYRKRDIDDNGNIATGGFREEFHI